MFRQVLFAVCLLFTCAHVLNADDCSAKPHPTFRVSVDPALGNQRFSGRLLIMMSSQLGPRKTLRPSFGPDAHSVWVAAREVTGLSAEQAANLDPNDLAYPEKFCSAPPGTYYVKAVLDVNHDFAYDYGESVGDLVSAIEQRPYDPASAEPIALTLTESHSTPPAPPVPMTEAIDFVSPSLSAFWGRPIHITGMVVLPPSYGSSHSRYPTVYLTHGFGADLSALQQRNAPNLVKLTAEKKIPEMIWVLLVEAHPGGTHEFADSVNNGPWGKALTAELIPYLEKKYRMDAKPSGRFLTGHSSGGWAALWLQVAYPAMFGGTWPTAPDPGDFRNFALVDLTQHPPQNFFYDANGAPHMVIRMDGKDVQSLGDLALQERVLGEYGGQLASFEWVFSPRGKDGRPMPLFDRTTGAIDPDVADYWEEHYDISSLLRRNWKKIGPLLDGKIHLTVGTLDTIHLNEPAQLLEQTIKSLGGKASFTYMEGRSHFDLYQGDLMERIASEMYAVARPAGKAAQAAATKSTN